MTDPNPNNEEGDKKGKESKCDFPSREVKVKGSTSMPEQKTDSPGNSEAQDKASAAASKVREVVENLSLDEMKAILRSIAKGKPQVICDAASMTMESRNNNGLITPNHAAEAMKVATQTKPAVSVRGGGGGVNPAAFWQSQWASQWPGGAFWPQATVAASTLHGTKTSEQAPSSEGAGKSPASQKKRKQKEGSGRKSHKKKKEKEAQEGESSTTAPVGAGSPHGNSQAAAAQMAQMHQQWMMMNQRFSGCPPQWPPPYSVPPPPGFSPPPRRGYPFPPAPPHYQAAMQRGPPPPRQPPQLHKQPPADHGQRTVSPPASAPTHTKNPPSSYHAPSALAAEEAAAKRLRQSDIVVKPQLVAARALDFFLRPRPSRSGDGSSIPVDEDDPRVGKNPDDRLKYRVLLILKEWDYCIRTKRDKVKLAEAAIRIACYDDGYPNPRGTFAVDRWFKQFRDSLRVGCSFRTRGPRRDLGMRRAIKDDNDSEDESAGKDSNHGKRVKDRKNAKGGDRGNSIEKEDNEKEEGGDDENETKEIGPKAEQKEDGLPNKNHPEGEQKLGEETLDAAMVLTTAAVATSTEEGENDWDAL